MSEHVEGANARRQQRAADAITAAWPDGLGEEVLAAVVERDAFGALAYRIEQARRDQHDPVAILRGLDIDTVEWALDAADDPAAFLASRVTRALDDLSRGEA